MRKKTADCGFARHPAACGFALRLPAACGFALLLLSAGCGGRIETGYGRRAGPGATGSVNGTAVLGEMFEQVGHKVFSWRRLSPKLQERADCIVWFPDDFEPPSADVRRWLDQWLSERPGRTLIYVGRDFDAAGWYWDTIAPTAPEEQQAEIRRRAVKDKSDFNARRAAMPKSKDCDWFTLDSQPPRRKVRSLQGQSEWHRDMDPAKLDVELGCRFLPTTDTEVLLESEGDMLIGYRRWHRSQVIVVTNGSFLLNLPLVNHEHRKLAGKLIDKIGPPSQTVVFLESGSDGPPIRDDDPLASPPTGVEIFNVWPTNWILLHLAAVGVIFCCWRFPIFGRPYEPRPDSPSDFGKHIDAMAALLERTGNHGYARTRLLHYQQTTKRGE